MPKVGFKLIGTIKEVKGFCHAGHKVGDTIELDGHDSGGLCGFFIMIYFHILSCSSLEGVFRNHGLKIKI